VQDADCRQPCPTRVHITEWLYSGSGGEFVELINVGSSAYALLLAGLAVVGAVARRRAA